MENRNEERSIEDLVRICAPPDVDRFVADLEAFVASAQNRTPRTEAQNEFCFRFCLEHNRKEASPPRTAQKRRRGQTVFTECIDPEKIHRTSSLLPERTSGLLELAALCEPVFAQIEPQIRKKLLEKMALFGVVAGTEVIRQNTHGEFLAIIYTGLFDVFIDGKHSAVLRPGNTFGEIAIIHNTQRTATVRARTDAEIFCMDRNTYRETQIFEQHRKMLARKRFLTQIPLFASLPAEKIAFVADALGESSYGPGEDIVTEGEVGDVFFVIQQGETAVLKESDGGERKEVAVLGPKNCFGEIALLGEGRRTATIRAKTHTVCFTLERKVFVHLVGDSAKTEAIENKTIIFR
ncbi:MAG: cAMP-dependent protein kinase regulatory subunit [Amphiamblys sp. WSBS2006]|nr:MAG: cAMP-dependent protein kinase regulatory subunit [Amphiamblys sp. WSBS2006]